MDSIAILGLGCPAGGTFHICQNTAVRFVGCCVADPCSAGGVCPQDRLRPSSFNMSNYNKIPPQACSSTKANWCTCGRGPITFLGCCLSNACQIRGGPTTDLMPARLSDDSQDAAIFIPPKAWNLNSSLAISTSTIISTPSETSATSMGDSTVTSLPGMPQPGTSWCLCGVRIPCTADSRSKTGTLNSGHR